MTNVSLAKKIAEEIILMLRNLMTGKMSVLNLTRLRADQRSSSAPPSGWPWPRSVSSKMITWRVSTAESGAISTEQERSH